MRRADAFSSSTSCDFSGSSLFGAVGSGEKHFAVSREFAVSPMRSTRPLDTAHSFLPIASKSLNFRLELPLLMTST